MAEKLRELMPELNDAIMALTNMASDISKLEYTDNEQAAKRLKRSIISFKNGPLTKFEKAVKEVRSITVLMAEARKTQRREEYESGKRVKQVKGFFKKEVEEASE